MHIAEPYSIAGVFIYNLKSLSDRLTITISLDISVLSILSD